MKVEAGPVTRSDRELINISVTDSGIGIRQEDQLKLFSAFARIGAPGQLAQEGTGLGLHLSRQLANLLGGEITLQSEYGKGSTFTLTLPIDKA